ncbi:MAG TPA: DUF6545 domain-containing protein [Nitrolancea sp.]|nr:DUF6545 domain-containing protein [Nitrolancea sp.]
MSRLSVLLLLGLMAYAALIWVLLTTRLWSRRRHELTAVDYVASCCGFLALGLMLTTPLPPVAAEVDRLAGRVGVAEWLADVGALLAALGWVVYLSRLVPPEQRWYRVRRTDRWVPLLPVTALTAVALAVGAGRFIWAPGRLGYHFGPQPDPGRTYLVAAHLVYRATLLVDLALLIPVLRRLGEVAAGTPVLRARLQAIRGWSWYTIGHISYECATIFLPLPDWMVYTRRQMSLFLVLAIIAPDWWYEQGLALLDQVRDTVWRWQTHWSRWRDYQRLYPFWAALYPVQPGVSLLDPPQDRAPRPDRPKLTFTVYRLGIEIDDWRTRLYPYRPVPVAPGPPTAATEAWAVATALRAWQAGTPATPDRPPGQAEPELYGGATMEEEIAALVRVAVVFNRIMRNL